jgi:chromosomal replication initiation ATPase DnaA
MKLSIERLGSRSGSQFKLMYDGLELCRTNSQKNAMLIKSIFDDKNIDAIEPENTIYSILLNIKIKTGIDLMTNLSRKRQIADIRFIYCKIATDAGFSQSETGEPIKRDHASVFNALAKFNDFYETDRKFRELYNKIIS